MNLLLRNLKHMLTENGESTEEKEQDIQVIDIQPQAEETDVPETHGPVLTDVHEFTPKPEALVKALIFASPDFVNIQTLKKILGQGWDVPKIRQVVKSIIAKMETDGEPFEIVEVNNSYHFRTKPRFYPWIKQLFREAGARKLSQAALEILALVAYKQPITKAEIEEIRGVNVDGPLKGLLDRKLIAIVGKSEKIGNPFEYGTTKKFLQYFNINKVPEDLPKLSEFDELIKSTQLLPQVSPSGDLIEGELNQVDDF